MKQSPSGHVASGNPRGPRLSTTPFAPYRSVIGAGKLASQLLRASLLVDDLSISRVASRPRLAAAIVGISEKWFPLMP